MSCPEYDQNPIDGRPTSSLAELLFKAVVITTTINIAAGHLTTLRTISLKYKTDIFTLVIGFLLLPTLPLASLLCCFWRSVWKALCNRRTGPGGDFLYYVCATLGMEVVPIPSKNP